MHLNIKQVWAILKKHVYMRGIYCVFKPPNQYPQSGPGLSLLLKVRPNVLHGLLTRLPAVLASDCLDHLDNL